jgi:DNA-binding NtrC family response regulator
MRGFAPDASCLSLDRVPKSLKNWSDRVVPGADDRPSLPIAHGLMTRLLLVDDDPALILDQIEHVFVPRRVQVTVAGSGIEGLRSFKSLRPDVVLLDLRLPDMSGLDVFREIHKFEARTPVVFITATTAADTAIEAVRQGAFDYLFKPVDLQQLDHVVSQALELGRLMRVPAVVTETPSDELAGDAIIGHCPAMREVYKAIGRVADQPVIVLITGESGTGKELVARAIYQHGARAKAPFLAINCAAIPENLLESELFGHEKGAFTGADRRRIGKFEQCNGGTIFLDEIGDMPLATQGKMLRLLQDQTFERVGGNETIRTDVRVIAATNRDLQAMCDDGRFRPDLFYRISVFTIALPPLRERGEDLPMLVNHYIRKFNRELDRELREVSPEALAILAAYSWPGNIRELQSVLKQALLRASGTVLVPAFLPEFRRHEQNDSAKSGASAGFQFEALIRQQLEAGAVDLYAPVHERLDRIFLPMVLRFANGNQHQAARLLGIARQTLRQKMRDLGLNVTHSVEAEEREND